MRVKCELDLSRVALVSHRERERASDGVYRYVRLYINPREGTLDLHFALTENFFLLPRPPAHSPTSLPRYVIDSSAASSGRHLRFSLALLLRI